MPGTLYPLEVNPQIPPRLERMEDLANNLWYSWDRATRALFSSLSRTLWQGVGHNPKSFLKRVDQKRLEAAADDPIFLGRLNRVLSAYDSYHDMPPSSYAHAQQFQKGDLIAYFCAEFGFHESLPIYSGGLGILAGDHCKAASDMGLPFVGVGLLYRQGYFHQQLDADGGQHPTYFDSDFDDLPVTPLTDENGGEIRIHLAMPGRAVEVKLWEALVGHVRLILLDTHLPANSEHDRDLTHRLYGGDRTTRMEQELLLGIGGVQALAAIGVKPTVWHINEGHAAFLVLERIRGLMREGLDFSTALEAVAAGVVFTTHTPVPAGHDHFSEDMIRHYFADWCQELGISPEQLFGLGAEPGKSEFNMTALAIRGSRFHNGVSRIHGDVSAHICGHMWPQVEAVENPMSYVTNGVHMSTFLANEWYETFERHLGVGWQQRQTDPACWQGIARIPDQTFWSIRQILKAQMLHLVCDRLREQQTRNQGSAAHLDRVLRLTDPSKPNVLTIGFARRFATYKRATLLFQNLDWLRELVSDPERPVIFIFAGKAHPADRPGQEMIRRIAEIGNMPEFEGHILLVEGYDLHLSRRLVAGVDVWLNNPIYPLEASGTSGMKAAMNGAINLSVLDGWWGEGYDAENPNGWAIKPAPGHMNDAQRDAEEARTLYEILQDQVIPTYYRIGPMGFSPEWVALAKRSIASVAPRFNVMRMVGEYADRFYSAAALQARLYAADDYGPARTVAGWKAQIRQAWPDVRLARLDAPPRRLAFGESIRIEMAVHSNGLAPQDIAVEAIFGRPASGRGSSRERHYAFRHAGQTPDGALLYALDLTPEQCGKLEYRIRAYPFNPLLTHKFELGLMLWL